MVWTVYGKYDGKYLEKLTHCEIPWQRAWNERSEDTEKEDSIITKESMKEYYKNLKDSLNINPHSLENLNKVYCSIG